MANRQETQSYRNPVEKFAQALTNARKMQHDWLTYGVDFVHFYVEDADSDWLQTWGNDEILCNRLLDAIKEFLVSDDHVASRIRQYLGKRSLFDLAVNLEQCWRIVTVDERLNTIRNILAGQDNNVALNNEDLLNLAANLLEKLAGMSE
ncbi:hypothetical protein [Umezakia ovalisporum]|jgi:hypothetical protein|uniref:Uncharacterized protein n=2 Tax=Umezakia ovalisporum TaxID=75695 RepID=A0AA43GWX6_9CYAN|nr:hypothetical protein [Umezakia ovalisporum]MBI1243220.1 hypothetical protein [Nostoc sp. RI_552]MDH6056816.1 hypothetical protein [Umezakia ovalisporum FSS-43]MDH6062747.1 hypothetical protein [Umezakia ovalisporum FSS-62]MDH6068190.1 hypothetical protein [Umezakia ovalisporum APH033B]MDH6072231.1 hypothetical protein [Umezakia ovalisporum CobakiLakeA]